MKIIHKFVFQSQILSLQENPHLSPIHLHYNFLFIFVYSELSLLIGRGKLNLLQYNIRNILKYTSLMIIYIEIYRFMIVYFMIIYIGRPKVIIKYLNKNLPQTVDSSHVQMLCSPSQEFLNVRDSHKGLHDKDDN